MTSISDRIFLTLGKSESWPLGWGLFVSAALVGCVTGLRLSFESELAGRFVYMSYVPAVSIAAVVRLDQIS